MQRFRIIMPSVTMAVLLLLLSPLAAGQAPEIDKSHIDSGVIQVAYYSDHKGAVRIAKDGVIHDYALSRGNRFPLQLGNGAYTISVLENIEGIMYRQIAAETVTLQLADENDVYLQSIQMINWNEEMAAVQKVRELTAGFTDPGEKTAAVYDYIIENIVYDYPLAETVTSDYLPDIDRTLQNGAGICYDYSSLFAAMLRSQGIPTKLVMGTREGCEQYHAWNQVYLSDQWVTIDTTYDAGMAARGLGFTMIKDAEKYLVKAEF